MKPVIRSAKHVKYVLGSMSAVLFTIVGGNNF